uniref:Uncharacterized protein n=1 Tax=Syphacia muris TaxID=451379 RepID=A0A0N5AV13_9BILA
MKMNCRRSPFIVVVVVVVVASIQIIAAKKDFPTRGKRCICNEPAPMPLQQTNCGCYSELNVQSPQTVFGTGNSFSNPEYQNLFQQNNNEQTHMLPTSNDPNNPMQNLPSNFINVPNTMEPRVQQIDVRQQQLQSCSSRCLNACVQECLYNAAAEVCKPLCQRSCDQNCAQQVGDLPSSTENVHYVQQCTDVCSNNCFKGCVSDQCRETCSNTCFNACQEQQLCPDICQPQCLISCVTKHQEPPPLVVILEKSSEKRECQAACHNACNKSCVGAISYPSCVQQCEPKCEAICDNDSINSETVITETVTANSKDIAVNTANGSRGTAMVSENSASIQL